MIRSLFAGIMLLAAPVSEDKPKPSSNSAVASYTLGAGDKLRITVFDEPALTGSYVVTADGTISFPLIGEISAQNRTIADVRETIRERLGSGYVFDPRVAVEPISYRPYYVLGEVAKPGEYSYSAGLRIEQAIAAAGGFTYRANRGSVFVRSNNDDQEKKIKLRKQASMVSPGDTIRVGERYL
jgi:polysaccharide export outer membrane protein